MEPGINSTWPWPQWRRSTTRAALPGEPHHFEAGDRAVGELGLQVGHLALPRPLHEIVVLVRQQLGRLKVERVLLLLLKHALCSRILRRAVAGRE